MYEYTQTEARAEAVASIRARYNSDIERLRSARDGSSNLELADKLDRDIDALILERDTVTMLPDLSAMYAAIETRGS